MLEEQLEQQGIELAPGQLSMPETRIPNDADLPRGMQNRKYKIIDRWERGVSDSIYLDGMSVNENR